MKALSILGATGSIGRQTMEVVASLGPELVKVEAVAANNNVELLSRQAVECGARLAVCADVEAYGRLQSLLSGTDVETACGEDGLIRAATLEGVDMVVGAMVGASGLRPSLAALAAGKDLALANKETLVAGGHLVTQTAEESQAKLIPIDSEHSAVFQCLIGQPSENLKRIILTASGGPFRQVPREEMMELKPEDALKHPNWSMGRKVTIDSSTLMNKGLEVIEAHWLFNIGYGEIDVVIHPSSVVHSMVELVDGALLAQLGLADMRLPISYAITYPLRRSVSEARLDILKAGSLEFHEPDRDRFPCLDLAYEAGRIGGTLPAVLNAANEIAVEAFLGSRLRFPGIPGVVESVMTRYQSDMVDEGNSLEAVLAADEWARIAARESIAALVRWC